jgi:DNA (cytosine-5)-methyltransferase 1
MGLPLMKPLRFGSVCSGIEAASVAWDQLGWKAAWFSEIEPFPCAVLAHHYPDAPNLGDMTKFKEWPDEPIDLLCGGTPCQSFSVAGLRKGLDDPRGNLMLTFGAIAAKYRPQWVVWENVPGVLSSNGGRDFGAFLGMLGQLGYGVAYRILDAQYFGVAQRRRRVFVVGCLGDWRSAAAVLFERHSLSGHPAPRRKKGQEFTHAVAPCLTSSGRGVKNTGDTRGQDPVVAVTCMAHGQGGAEIAENCSPTLTCNHEAPIAAYGIPGNWIGRKPENGSNATEPPIELSPCMTKTDIHAVAYLPLAFPERLSGTQCASTENLSPSLCAANPTAVALPAMRVRRLLPVECERLMGFPDGYTDIKTKGKPTPDGPRYKALGNSWAVPVVHWIGQRISNLMEAQDD